LLDIDVLTILLVKTLLSLEVDWQPTLSLFMPKVVIKQLLDQEEDRGPATSPKRQTNVT